MLKMKPYWTRVGPKANDWGPRKEPMGTHMGREEGHREMEAEIRVMQP